MWKKALLALVIVSGTHALAGCVIEPIGYGRTYVVEPMIYVVHPHHWGGYYGR